MEGVRIKPGMAGKSRAIVIHIYTYALLLRVMIPLDVVAVWLNRFISILPLRIFFKTLQVD